MKFIKLNMKFLLLAFLGMSAAWNANAGNRISYVINDHLGTPQIMVDQNKNVVWKANYDAFGKADIVVNQVELNIRFPGQYYDKETGLHYNYYRDYDPSTGRYVQSDPIGLRGGINTYGYVGGNPVIYTDSSGLAIDIFLDLGFIAYDIGKLASDGLCNLGENLSALGLDTAGAAIPFASGLGLVARAGSKMDKVLKSLPKLDETGKLHGELPDIQDLKNLDKDTLSDLREDLMKSLDKRKQVTKELGADAGHSARENAESDLLKSLNKHLGK